MYDDLSRPAVHLHYVPGGQFAPPASLNLGIHKNAALGDQVLGLAAGGRQARDFHELAQCYGQPDRDGPWRSRTATINR